ncbi:hypothetical protein [Dysgonomonas sp. HGC4]|uniref:hypothetical protein n=2 Tax=Dysgonomonas sp. HGC4 TaxID=1658009 RepID=UPI000A46174E|nr:hypothetical protein [Dysgonomonas sp. HGC4]MBD8349815.1 hypothetical protein [Dysgonomonas sp. HGC4]
MRLFLFIISTTSMLLVATNSIGQTVGINTINPLATLDIIASTEKTASAKVLKVTNSNATEIATTTNLGRFGSLNSSPATRLDIRNPSNNSSIGIGTTSITAATIGAGAIRYDPSTEMLQYSDGVQWMSLVTSEARTCIIANNGNATVQFPNNTSTTITKWTTTYDANNNFNPTTGIFTAPKDGVYTACFMILCRTITVNANSYIQATLISERSSLKWINAYSSSGSIYPSIVGSGSFALQKGETLRINVSHNVGATCQIWTNERFTNLAIVAE